MAELRTATAEDEPVRWGVLDVILAILMLPFGIWMYLIDRMVIGMAWLFNRP